MKGLQGRNSALPAVRNAGFELVTGGSLGECVYNGFLSFSPLANENGGFHIFIPSTHILLNFSFA